MIKKNKTIFLIMSAILFICIIFFFGNTYLKGNIADKSAEASINNEVYIVQPKR